MIRAMTDKKLSTQNKNITNGLQAAKDRAVELGKK
jgi:hypothetical protein